MTVAPTLGILGRRLGGLLVTMVAASFAVFLSLYLTPGSPLAYLTGGRSLSPEALASITAQYRLDDPFLARYLGWLGDLLTGDFGTSIVYGESVSSLLATRAWTTVALVAYASLLILVAGISAGIGGALRPGGIDASILVGTTIGSAIPSFVAASLLIGVFSVTLGWLPAYGTGSGPLGLLRHLTLPAVALAIAACSYVARITRTAVRAELGREHIETARSRGLAERVVIRRHVVRNALLPIVTVSGITIASLVSGAVVVESAFSLNGLGSYLVLAVQQKDFPVVQAIVLILVVVFVVVNALVDIVCYFLDPRLGAEGSG